ncbi:MAG: antibiotic ABC transporter [Rhodobacteraceae bacterium]|nr:antibiotic ABC transporter [Paracoccaceae bacterium]
MAFEAQVIISIRTLGIIGVLPAAPDETTRMVLEKVRAFQSGTCAAAQLAAAGKPAQAVFAGAVAPYRRTTASNYTRLTRPLR